MRGRALEARVDARKLFADRFATVPWKAADEIPQKKKGPNKKGGYRNPKGHNSTRSKSKGQNATDKLQPEK